MSAFTRGGFWVGAIGFFAILGLAHLDFVLPEGLTVEGLHLAAVVFLMATWWVTEALHLAATSLIPLVAFPLLGIASVKEVSPAYADRFILLLMGGFFVALTLEKWNLHRRIALGILRRIGTEPRRLVLSFMITTAVLSMWISNTATGMSSDASGSTQCRILIRFVRCRRQSPLLSAQKHPQKRMHSEMPSQSTWRRLLLRPHPLQQP